MKISLRSEQLVGWQNSQWGKKCWTPGFVYNKEAVTQIKQFSIWPPLCLSLLLSLSKPDSRSFCLFFSPFLEWLSMLVHTLYHCMSVISQMSNFASDSPSFLASTSIGSLLFGVNQIWTKIFMTTNIKTLVNKNSFYPV